MIRVRWDEASKCKASERACLEAIDMPLMYYKNTLYITMEMPNELLILGQIYQSISLDKL